MKVAEARIYVVDTGSYRPIVVELRTDEGITGAGEAAMGFGIGTRSCAEMTTELAEAFVVGRDAFRIAEIWNDCFYHTFWGKGGGTVIWAAAGALEMALWDIKGKALGVPVYEMLGGKQRDEIQVYANDWSRQDTPAAFARRAQEVVMDGFDMIKVYPLSLADKDRNINRHIKNREISRELEDRCCQIVREVRYAVGDKIRIMVDLTCEPTPDVAARIGKRIAVYDPYWYEEPVDPSDPEGYRKVRCETGLSVAGGERLYTRCGFLPFLEKGCLDIVQPDPGTCGGILEAFSIGRMAEAADVRFAAHNCGGPVLTAACVQLSAALGNAAAQEIFPYRPEIHYAIVEEAYENKIENGRLAVPEQPGLGIQLNHKVTDRFLYREVR